MYQDGFELNFILSAQDMAPEFRDRISIQYENFLIAIDKILDEITEVIVKQHEIPTAQIDLISKVGKRPFWSNG